MSAATIANIKLTGAEKEAAILNQIRAEQATPAAPTFNVSLFGSFFNIGFKN